MNKFLKTFATDTVCLTLASFAFAAVASAEIISVDVGLSEPLRIDNSKPLKIALFMRGQSNSGLAAVVRGAQNKARELNVPLDVFDAKFESANMVNQMQNALLRDYTAWVVFPTGGSAAVCDMITEQAPSANILVSVNVEAACVDALTAGPELWAPGTIGFVGGNETITASRILVQRAVDDHPGKVKVGIVNGPLLDTVSSSLLNAVKEAEAANPNFEVVVRVESKFDVPEAFAKSATMFQANPDLDVVITQFSAMTRGVIAAIESGGVTRTIDIYESGGTEWSAEMIKAGKVKVTLPLFLETNGATGVANVHKVYNGAPIPKFSGNDGHAPLPGQEPGKSALIDASNVDSFEPEFN